MLEEKSGWFAVNILRDHPVDHLESARLALVSLGTRSG